MKVKVERSINQTFCDLYYGRIHNQYTFQGVRVRVFNTTFNNISVISISFTGGGKPSICLIFFHLVAEKPNLENFSIYSNKFFHNFHLSESSFTCSGTSGKWVSVKTVNRSTQRKSPTCRKSLTKLVVIGTDYIGSCKSNYHTIMTTMGFLQICHATTLQ